MLFVVHSGNDEVRDVHAMQHCMWGICTFNSLQTMKILLQTIKESTIVNTLLLNLSDVTSTNSMSDVIKEGIELPYFTNLDYHSKYVTSDSSTI